MVQPAAPASQASGQRRDEDLAAEFVQLITRMRGEARMNFLQFLHAAQSGFGGTLVVQAPCTARKRTNVEAGFRSERWAELGL